METQPRAFKLCHRITPMTIWKLIFESFVCSLLPFFYFFSLRLICKLKKQYGKSKGSKKVILFAPKLTGKGEKLTCG